MKIEFNTTPDVVGLGRIIVDGKFYGLPIAAVELFQGLYIIDQLQTAKINNDYTKPGDPFSID
jgi:hypothetical protein